MIFRPRFLSVDQVVAIHRAILLTSGGSSGIRDTGLLESALARPVNRWEYEKSDVPKLATDYAFGIARNHPFVDGNKRTCFIAAYTFLGRNGFDFVATEPEVVLTIEILAAGALTEDELAHWFRENSKGRK